MKKIYSIYVDILILVIFTIIFLYKKNYEFIGYIISMVFVLGLVYYTDKKFNYPLIAMWGFSLWLFLHMAGGAFIIQGVKLYGTMIIKLIGSPYYILRYDQLVHFFCYFIITFFMYSIIMKKSKTKKMDITLLTIIVLSAIGIGTLNEIIEFIMVIVANAGKDVGGYTNTLLDLIFNLFGSIVAIFIAILKNSV